MGEWSTSRVAEQLASHIIFKVPAQKFGDSIGGVVVNLGGRVPSVFEVFVPKGRFTPRGRAIPLEADCMKFQPFLGLG